MVVIPNREPDVFAAISHPARRRMLDLLIETARSVNALAGHFQMSRPSSGMVENAAIASSLRSLGPYGTGWRTMSGSGMNT